MIRPKSDTVPAADSDLGADNAPVDEKQINDACAAAWNLDDLPPELDYFRGSEAYQVELTGFQGPMDLLLYLIQKEQLDIYDIPIARITDQFIKHIEIMKSIALDTAGEFMAMAATLMLIKTRMLMPSHVDEDIEEDDPRTELVQRLLEYKRFKEAAQELQKFESQRRNYHLRSTPFPYTDRLDLDPPLRIGMFDLLSALAGVFDRVTKTPEHRIEREPYTVQEKIALIQKRFETEGNVLFEELFSDDAIKMEVIVTFIAILELVKRNDALFVQTEVNGSIWLQPRNPEEDDDDGEDAGGKEENSTVAQSDATAMEGKQ